ncbi:MAG: MoaD/ThiS family protein [Candidatus Freyarchaeota archaeon]|nr:MoaD/ThiS family protein [Candidatus Jordarchaeia archaeon]MBS7269631.1 MoaD/ThiS family protein [Candidatus Jordarchaeia archaeon]MBS7281481.1 MoaD/ThiS family protein [Candidatus Jordarchaeia archaeon]
MSESETKQGGGLIKIISNQRQTVAELLQEMGLEQEFFAVLIDGKKANLDEEIEKGTKIIVLPKIKGG